MKAFYLRLMAAALLVTACGDKPKPQTPSAHRGVYHWKTTYDPTDWEKKWIDLFISVNISPKDFYFMDVASEIKALARE